ncbi:MAG: hypothetical protein D4Q79_00995 [Spirochaetia bacterium]|nr:MAG: hypothetical protein D4Q79_00995 [Spirochaetia bacterium]
MKNKSKYLFIALSAITAGLLIAVGVMAFTGPGANQPPAGSPTSSLGGVPSGAVMFFNLANCPSGWTEYTAARGRTVVGTPSGGTNTGTTGTALTDLANRTITDVPAHSHSVNPPATATDSQGAHTHSGGAAGGMDTSGSGSAPTVVTTTGSAGAHTHTVDIAAFNSASTGVASVDVTMPYIQLRACSKD